MYVFLSNIRVFATQTRLKVQHLPPPPPPLLHAVIRLAVLGIEYIWAVTKIMFSSI